MAQQVEVNSEATAGAEADDGTQEVAADLAFQRLAIVNVAYFGLSHAASGNWVLIDAGVSGTTGRITRSAENRFGKDSRPAAIVLTHGHFDHVGALADLAERWNVPIYAHELEFPHLDGTSLYPPPDPSVGGGLMATLSRFYPRGPIDVSRWLRRLPMDKSVPHMPGWSWIHTPGHTSGHVSLWREEDRTLIAGDAFITTAQESAYAVMTQRPELHGPPMYYTTDWESARASVERLASLQPELVVTGHGPAMRGAEMRRSLEKLAREFNQVAVPQRGRYVNV
jgi:glyoxylase-like metal-dependent hydrolase (beta-lactamase superfamily II)